MPANTTYRPARVLDFEYSKLNYNAQGVKANPTLNETTNIDLYFSDDHLITGFWVVGADVSFGDKIDLQVVDIDNIFGLGAGTVVNQFATNIYLPSGNFDQQFDVAYPAKIFAGLSLRVVYHSSVSTGNTPSFAVNYKIHKVLI